MINNLHKFSQIYVLLKNIRIINYKIKTSNLYYIEKGWIFKKILIHNIFELNKYEDFHKIIFSNPVYVKSIIYSYVKQKGKVIYSWVKPDEVYSKKNDYGLSSLFKLDHVGEILDRIILMKPSNTFVVKIEKNRVKK
jgi:hypothetical protein